MAQFHQLFKIKFSSKFRQKTRRQTQSPGVSPIFGFPMSPVVQMALFGIVGPAAAPEMTPVRRMCRLPRPPKPWGRVRVKKGCFSSDVASYRPRACIRVDEPSHTGSLLHRSPYAAVSLPRKILHHAFSSSPEKNLHFHLSPVPPTYTITIPAMHNHRESR